MISGSPTPEEAAAVMAAIDRFVAETTVVVVPDDSGPSPWVRAALLEATDREPQRGVWL